MENESKERHRLDVWLKQVCLYKQRSESTEDCNGGKVRLNGNRARAASPVKENDVVEIRKAGRERKFVVLSVPGKQVPKDAAALCYRDESPPPPPRDDLFAGARSAPRAIHGEGRPTKRDRRHMERDGFGRQSSE
jgi:ribosome-associated heat shock protein Hsp15